MAADAEPGHPFDLVAVWLAALAWVADSRWRRLSSGPHTAALLEWLEALDLRVVALRLAEPEDLGAAESPGGWLRGWFVMASGVKRGHPGADLGTTRGPCLWARFGSCIQTATGVPAHPRHPLRAVPAPVPQAAAPTNC